jgi:hypothetical protein
MNDDQLKAVQVVLTEDLAARSLAVANAGGMSRSELVRLLLIAYLNGATT